MDPERIQGGGAVFSGAFSPLTGAGRITGKTGNPKLTTTGKIALLSNPIEQFSSRSFFAICCIIRSLPEIFLSFVWFRNHYVPPDPEQQHMGEIIDNPRLRERKFVFSDRHDAGRQLGAFIKTLPPIRDPVVLAIPAGGVPIGKEVAAALGAHLSLAIVRKIRIPGTTEAGFGAVTWDGQVLINDGLRAALGLSADEVEVAIAETRKNVNERIARFIGGRAVPALAGKTVILTDDGLASGFTMLAAAKSIRLRNPDRVIVAVPTASASSAELVSHTVDQLVCLNIRTSRRFAVAEAYEQWYDLDDREVLEELAGIP